MFKKSKVEWNVPMVKSSTHTNWLSEGEVKCTITYNYKNVSTICRIKDAELQFENGDCSFRLSKITKMKVAF